MSTLDQNSTLVIARENVCVCMYTVHIPSLTYSHKPTLANNLRGILRLVIAFFLFGVAGVAALVVLSRQKTKRASCSDSDLE